MPGTVAFFKLFLSFHRLVGLYRRESSEKIMQGLIDEFNGRLIKGDIYTEGFTNFVLKI